jgi:predicted DNA-binding transcriptional regulator AlpA
MSEPDNDAVLDAVAAASFTGLAVATLAKLRCIGGGPEYLKLGRKVVYRRSDLANWLNARRVANTTQAAISFPPRLTNACSKAAKTGDGSVR